MKEWKPLWINVQIEARKLFQCIMVPLASLLQATGLAWVGPEHLFPFQLCLWVQEGDFISPEQKAQEGHDFEDHISKGQGDPSHTFSPVKTMWWWTDHFWEREVLRNCWGERLLRQWSEKQREMSTMHWEHMEWPAAWSWETSGRDGRTFPTGTRGITAGSDPSEGGVLCCTLAAWH